MKLTVVPVSVQMQRLFLHCINTLVDLDPPCVDDVDDIISALTEEEITKICSAPDDEKVIGEERTLRQKLYWELVDIEIALPENTCGFLREILGDVERADDATEQVLAEHAKAVEGID